MSCAVLQGIYLNPTSQPNPPEDGVSVYGDPALFFRTCDDYAPVPKYNQFCGAPLVQSQYTAACDPLMAQHQDNGELIFNQLIADGWSDWPLRSIPQFATDVLRTWNTSDQVEAPLVYGTDDGNIVAAWSPVLRQIAVGSGRGPQLEDTQFTSLRDVDGMAVSQQNPSLFYLQSTGLYRSRLSTSGNWSTSRLSSTLPFDSTHVIRMCVSGNANRVFVAVLEPSEIQVHAYTVSTQLWSICPNVPGSPTQLSSLTCNTTGTLVLCVAVETGIGRFYGMKFPLVVPFTNWIAWLNTYSGHLILAQAMSGNSAFVLRNGGALNGLYMVDFDVNVFVTQETAIAQPPLLAGDSIGGIAWNATRSQVASWIPKRGLYMSQGLPTQTNLWTLWSTAIELPLPPIVTGMSLSMYLSNSALCYFSEWVPKDDGFRTRAVLAGEDALSFFLQWAIRRLQTVILLDNGEIRAYQGNPLNDRLSFVSSTSDQTVSTHTLMSSNRFEIVLPRPNPVTVSKNGLYALIQSDQGVFRLVQNVINGAPVVAWGTLLTQRLTALRQAYVSNYCDQLPPSLLVDGMTNTYPDPRCLCYYPAELVAQMFNESLLLQNPAQYRLILGIAPCMNRVCINSKSEVSITSLYMRVEVVCPVTINVCTVALTIGGQGSLASDNVNVDNNCGSTAGKTPCASTCPVGTGCASDGFCALLCQSNADCGLETECQNGLCERQTSSSGGNALPIWAAVLIAAALIALIIGLSVGLTRRPPTAAPPT